VGAGVTIITVRDGKIASERDYFDSAAVMSQMTPMPGA
jgi:ketosteroid isomerase-like protein